MNTTINMKINKRCVIFFLLFSFKLYAQTTEDKNAIFTLILKDHISAYDYSDSSDFIYSTICLLDSTQTTISLSIRPDSLYKAYFGIEKEDYNSKMALIDSFLKSTKMHEKIPDSIIINKHLKIFSTDSLNTIFSSCLATSNWDSCWGNFYNQSKSDGYCSFSKPYFFNKNTALIYFYYMFGPTAGSGNLFILKKENDVWRIKEKIWQWIS
jgi:hypothetical protein